MNLNDNNKRKVTFKELWKNPFYNSLFKLLLWGLFIVCIIVFISLGSRLEVRKSNNSTSTEEENLSFSQMKNNMLKNPVNVVYTIGDYYIKGTVFVNNVLDATAENSDGHIYIIQYDNENLYQISFGNQEINNELLGEINLKYLLFKNIFDIIDGPDVAVDKGTDDKTYNYSVGDTKFSFSIGDNKIDEINIIENNINYNLKYEIIDDK